MPLGVVEHSGVSALREAKAVDPCPGTSLSYIDSILS